MREPELKELAGASRLAREFFNGLIRRIECTKPTAGTGIIVTEEDNGFKISTSGGEYNVVTLNVCSNGSPATLLVLTPKPASEE
jgi:hypothetical protein